MSAPAGTIEESVKGEYAAVGTVVELGVRETSVLPAEFRHSMRNSTPTPSGLVGVA